MQRVMSQIPSRQQQTQEIQRFVSVTWDQATILRAGSRTITSIQQLSKCPLLIGHPSLRVVGKGWGWVTGQRIPHLFTTTIVLWWRVRPSIRFCLSSLDVQSKGEAFS